MKTESEAAHTMTTQEAAARVSELAPLFLNGLCPEALAEILEAATVRHFPARFVVSREGNDAERIFLFIEGRARAFTMSPKGEKTILMGVFPGEIAGGRAALREPSKYLVSTETVVDSAVLVWTRNAFLPFLTKHPRVMENGLLTASDYLETYRDLLLAATHDTAGKRVARALDGWARSVGKKLEEGLMLNINNEELANQANVTIFTVSRLLSDWQRKGLLVKSRGKVVIRSQEALVDCVE